MAIHRRRLDSWKFLVGLGFALLVAGVGCADDKCKSEPPSFQLNVRLQDGDSRAQLRSLAIELHTDDRNLRRTYTIDEGLKADGVVSLAIELSPSPTQATSVELTVVGWSAEDPAAQDAVLLGRAHDAFDLSLDGCNLYELQLATPEPSDDGGVTDAQTGDAEDRDVGTPDAAVGDVGDAGDAGDAGVDGSSPDADVPDTNGQGDDAAVEDAADATVDDASVEDAADATVDDASLPDTADTSVEDAAGSDSGSDAGTDDASVPDVGGPVSFQYAPSRFDSGDYTPSADLEVTCDLTFNTSGASPSFLNCLGEEVQAVVVDDQTRVGAVLFPLSALRVASGATLHLVGTRTVIFAVYGDAAVAGHIDASAYGNATGAGAGDPEYCGDGAGDDGQTSGAAGGSGGGGGALGSAGGAGGRAGNKSGGAGGTTRLQEWATVPPLSGCPGGGGAKGAENFAGEGGQGGPGGGGVQLSVAGSFFLSGKVTASGEGGQGGMAAGSGGGNANASGGGGAGGGGSGGVVNIEAARLLINEGSKILANGGGGGKGGSSAVGGGASPAPQGDSGSEDADDRARGGEGTGDGGNGGAGAGARLAAVDGDRPAQGSVAGGGGGGGGVGFIRLWWQQVCVIDQSAVFGPEPEGSVLSSCNN